MSPFLFSDLQLESFKKTILNQIIVLFHLSVIDCANTDVCFAIFHYGSNISQIYFR